MGQFRLDKRAVGVYLGSRNHDSEHWQRGLINCVECIRVCSGKRVSRRRPMMRTMSGRRFPISSVCAFALILFSAMNASAQWATNGANINNTNSGNVGIGTTSPLFKLHLNVATNSDALAITGVQTPGFVMLTNS